MITAQLAAWIAGTATRALPPEVAAQGRLNLLDTVAAMVSGTRLVPGRRALDYARAEAGRPECSVPGTGLLTGPMDAALAGGMCGHADETDDSHADALVHPGCAVVPAALAMAERHDRDLGALLSAVVTGYEVGLRMSFALGASRMADHYHMASQSWGGTFGATAAAAVLAGLDEAKTHMALSYAVQHAAGNRCWMRDPEHVQKAFVFGGLPASSGVRAVLMARAGLTGVADPIEGTPGLAAAFRETSDPARAVEGLGEHWEIRRTILKKWSVGMPIQAALDSLQKAVADGGLSKADIDRIEVTLPEQRVRVVDSAMPNINLPHLLALFLVDGGVSFDSIHDHARMSDPEVRRVAARITVTPRPGAGRRDLAHLEVIAKGRRMTYAPTHVRGQPQDPMTCAEVAAKALDLLSPVVGAGRAAGLVTALAGNGPVRNLRDLWSI